MLGKENNQKDFFDSYVYENLLPAEHILLDIKEKIDFSFVDEEIKDLYDTQFGRPSYRPQILFKMLFLEFYYNLSDVEVAKQCRYNILYRYFIGLQIHEPTPDDTTLVVFRTRLGKERFERLFDKVINIAKENNLLAEKLKIIDATSIVADIAIPNTVNLLRQGRKIVLKRISKGNVELADKLKAKYITNTYNLGKPSQEELKDEIIKTKDFIDQLKGNFDNETEELIQSLKALSSPDQENKSKIVSFIDPDATNGAANSKKLFTGYKAHIAQDESGIVTSVDTLKAHQNEGSQLTNLLDKEKTKGLKSEAVAADSIYSSFDNRKYIQDQNMKAYIPKRRDNTKLDRYGFKYLPKEDKVICPQGKYSRRGIKHTSGKLYVFSSSTCKSCSIYPNCPVLDKRGWVRIFVSDDYKEYLKNLGQNYYLAQAKRKMIEPKIGEAKKWHNLSRARYRGKWKVAIQVLMTFLVINIKRIIKLIKEQTLILPQQAVLAADYG